MGLPHNFFLASEEVFPSAPALPFTS